MNGTVPFETVYFHGLVRDEMGQKMSKSKGNVVNPLEYVEKYGADALRMALVMSTTAGRDSNTGEDKIRGMRNFTNKIWNAARFIVMSRFAGQKSAVGKGDHEFSKHLDEVVKTITRQLNQLKIGLAAETIYNEFWHWFCDQCIERNKNGEISLEALTEGFKIVLKLLHPFMPFVTEEIWGKLGNKKELLISSLWPTK